MFTIECVVKSENNETFKYQAVAIPRINESIVFNSRVIHHANDIHTITLLVEGR